MIWGWLIIVHLALIIIRLTVICILTLLAPPAEDVRLVRLMLNNTEWSLVKILIIFPEELVFVRQRFLWFIPMTDVLNIAAQLVLQKPALLLQIKAAAPMVQKLVITDAGLIPDNVAFLVLIK